MNKLKAILVYFLMMSAMVSAADIYVNFNTGSDTTGDGSKTGEGTGPYQDIDKAVTVAVSDDTIKIEYGTDGVQGKQLYLSAAIATNKTLIIEPADSVTSEQTITIQAPGAGWGVLTEIAAYTFNVTFNSIDIDQSNSTGLYAALLNGSSGVFAFNDCNISGERAGINYAAGYSGTVTVTGGSMTHTASASSYAGIALLGSGDLVVDTCTFNPTSLGVYAGAGGYTGNITVSGSTFNLSTTDTYARAMRINAAATPGSLIFNNNTITNGNGVILAVGVTSYTTLEVLENTAVLNNTGTGGGILLGYDADWVSGTTSGANIKDNSINMGNVNSHAMLIGQGVTQAEVFDNELIAGNFQMVVKGHDNDLQGNYCEGAFPFFLAGAIDNLVTNNTCISTANAALLIDENNQDAAPTQSDGNIVFNNIFDGTTFTYAVELAGTNETWNTQMDFNCLQAGSGGLVYLDSTAIANMTDLRAKWQDVAAFSPANAYSWNDGFSLDEDPDLSPTRVPQNELVATGGNPAYEYYMGAVDPEITSINLVLQPQFITATAWPAVTDWVTTTGEAVFTSAGTDRTLAQPTIGLKVATYKVTFTASTISIQDPDGFYGVQLGNGDAFEFTQPGTYTVYIVAGSTPTNGLEISSANTTSGDTLTIDDVSVVVEQYKPSINLDSIFVTGGGVKVPAGSQLAVDSIFDNWSGVDPDETLAEWTLAERPATATNKITDTSTGLGLTMVADATALNLSQVALTAGKEYLITVDILSSTGTGYSIINDGNVLINSVSADASVQFVATGTDITIFAVSGTTEITSLTAYELTTGPIDQYDWDGSTMLNGERLYVSVSEHADGIGGTTYWYMANTIGSQRRITPSLSFTDPYFQRQNSQSLIGTYTASGVSPPAVGTATTTYGPADHSTATGSPAIKTNSGSVGLYSDYKNFDDDKELQWAWVSLIKPLADNDTTDRLLSFETADGVGYYWSQTAESTYNALWTGTTALDLDFTALETKVHNIMNFSDIAATSSWLTVDGVAADSQGTAAGLATIDPVKATLGSRNDAAADFYNGVYAGQFRLDLTGVTANEALKTALATVINDAALASNYDSHSIAEAINENFPLITGYYYALNESNSGDASNYYLIAYDIQTQTAITQGFYGLTSASGVTGTHIVITDGVGMYGPNKSQYGDIKSVYGTTTSQYGSKVHIFGSN